MPLELWSGPVFAGCHDKHVEACSSRTDRRTALAICLENPCQFSLGWRLHAGIAQYLISACLSPAVEQWFPWRPRFSYSQKIECGACGRQAHLGRDSVLVKDAAMGHLGSYGPLDLSSHKEESSWPIQNSAILCKWWSS